MQSCIKNAALPYANRHVYHLYHSADLVLLVTGQISVGAYFGREKGACDRAPEASADLSDFQTSPLPPLLEGEGKSLAPHSHGGTSTS